MSAPEFDHVALLVSSLGRAAARLSALGLEADAVAEFPGEGTREQYFGDLERPGRVLLLEPLGSGGPYARALHKRGPGLHHLALRVPGLDRYLAALSGWLLHPHSLTSRAGGTLWLARPGVSALVEVCAGKPSSDPPQVSLGVPGDLDLSARQRLIAGLGAAAGLSAAEGGAWLELAGTRHLLSELLC